MPHQAALFLPPGEISGLETQPRLSCCFLSFIGAKRGDCYADTGDKTSDISVPQARQLLASINAQTPVVLDGSSDLVLLVYTASRADAPLPLRRRQ